MNEFSEYIINQTDLSNVITPMYDMRIQCSVTNRGKSYDYIRSKRDYFKIFQPKEGVFALPMFCFNCERKIKIKLYSPSKFRDILMARVLIYLVMIQLLDMYKYEIWEDLVTHFESVKYGLLILMTIDIFKRFREGFLKVSGSHSARVIRKYSPHEYEKYLQTEKQNINYYSSKLSANP